MDWKKIGKKCLHPPVWLMILLAVFSAAGLAFVFLKELEESPVSYVIYMVSFYTLTVITISFCTVFPKRYQQIKQKIYDHPIGNRYMTDVTFKTHVSLYLSMGMNLLYVGSNLYSGIRAGSAWFITLAVYHIILAVMRFLLLRHVNKNGFGKNRESDLRRSQLCGAILLTINLALSGVVVLAIRDNESFRYAGMLIYVMAMYAFYAITISIVNIVKYQKYNSPILSTARTINLTTALVSLLSLETAMLSEFGQTTAPETKNILIAATGAGVSIVVVVMALLIIVRAAKERKASEEKEP